MVTAGYESGMDDSPMYAGVGFDRRQHTMEIHDVGLNSLHLADTKALIEMARILGRRGALDELKTRRIRLEKEMETLWSTQVGLCLNRHTGGTNAGSFSKRLSPTLFYPLLAKLPSSQRAERMVREHLINPREFWGEFVLPSISRSDPEFPTQRDWKGAIWPPLNFLVYLGLRQYGFEQERAQLAEKSLQLFVSEWRRKGYVSENYSAITGRGGDERLSSNRFHSWGALFGVLSLIEYGVLAPPELALPEPDSPTPH